MQGAHFFFHSFSSFGFVLFFYYFILFFTLDFSFFFTSSSERGVFRKQKTDFSINKLDRRHRSQGLFVEALKLPIWKLKKRKEKTDKSAIQILFIIKEKKRFSVCWKQQCCDNLKKKIAVHLYCHIVFQY